MPIAPRAGGSARALVVAALLALPLAGCGGEAQYEDYGINSADDLFLTPQNHPHGYGNPRCFSCHVEVNIHRRDRVDPGLSALARKLTRESGLKSCKGCHGDNGVPPGEEP